MQTFLVLTTSSDVNIFCAQGALLQLNYVGKESCRFFGFMYLLWLWVDCRQKLSEKFLEVHSIFSILSLSCQSNILRCFFLLCGLVEMVQWHKGVSKSLHTNHWIFTKESCKNLEFFNQGSCCHTEIYRDFCVLLLNACAFKYVPLLTEISRSQCCVHVHSQVSIPLELKHSACDLFSCLCTLSLS